MDSNTTSLSDQQCGLGETKRHHCTTIINNQGATIPIQPRCYIVEFKLPNTTTRKYLHSIVNTHISSTHTYDSHPEPLRDLHSAFLINQQMRTNNVYITLTNISSQPIRRQIMGHTDTTPRAITMEPIHG